MTFDLTAFDAAAESACTSALRAAIEEGPSLEVVGARACDWLRTTLVADGGTPPVVLARAYTTCPYGSLPNELQRFAKRALGSVSFSPPEPSMECLALLATRGEEEAWNDRRMSAGHQAIPLPSPEVVTRAPMIAQMIADFGIDVARLTRPRGGQLSVSRWSRSGIFHVESALGSPYIPAQDFVRRYHVQSVLGFGGALASGELFALIMFARCAIPLATADRFRNVARELMDALGNAGDKAVFSSVGD